jgi:hypothetical protein
MSDKCSIQLKNRLKDFYGSDKLDEKVGAFKAEVEGVLQRAQEEGSDPLKYLEDRIQDNVRQIELDAFRRMEQVKKYKEVSKQIDQFDNAVDGFRSLLYTRHGEKYQGNLSLEGQIAADRNRRIGIFKRELKEDMHILKRLKDGDEVLEREIYKLEYGELSQSELGKISQDAIKAHKAIKKLNDYDYKQKKVQGAEVGFQAKRMFRQYHDPTNMRELGQRNWVDLVRKNMKDEPIIRRIADDEKMTKKYEKSADPVEDFLMDHYEKIIVNESKKGISIEDTFQSSQFAGQQKGWEYSRLFEFKNADAQMGYNRNLNNVSLFQMISKDIIRDSGTVGSMSLLGPNPNLSITKLISEYGLENGDTLKREFRVAAGRKTGVASDLIPVASEKARKLTDMSLLSTSLFSTLPDLAIGAFLVSGKTGKNFFNTLGDIVGGNLKLIPKGKREEVARRLNILMDDELFDYHRLGEDGALNTKLDPFKNAILEDSPIKRSMAKAGRRLGAGIDYAHNKIMKMTGLPVQSQIMRLASTKNFAMYLSDVADTSFDQVYKGTKDLMDRVGIEERDWDILRQHTIKDLPDGSRIIDAEAVLDLTKEQVGMSNQVDFERYIYGLNSKVSGMYDFVANTASPTPGVRAKMPVEIIDPNTEASAAMKTMMQYKSFALSIYRSLQEGIGDRVGKDKYTDTATMMITSMGLAYLGWEAKNFIAGKDSVEVPNPVQNPKDFAKFSATLLGRAGTAGLMFDFVAADYNSPWKSLGGDLIGPSPRIAQSAISLAKSPLDIFMAEDNKETRKAKRNALNNLERLTPSIPFTRTLLNENIFDILHKAGNTGARR